MDNVPHEGALLDSGATACVQYVDQLDSREKVVPVYLASGSSLPCGRTVSAKGMPIVHMVGKQSTSILPLLWLIERHCTLTTDWTQLITPKGRRLHIIVADNLPWIGKQAVKDLMHDLPAAEEMGRSGRRASTNINVIFSLRVRCAAVTMKPQAPKALEDEAQGVDTAFEDQAQLDSRRRGSHVDARASETAASGICEKSFVGAAHVLAQASEEVPEPPTPSVAVTRTPEERQLRRQRMTNLKKIMQDDCHYPDLPTWNLRKKLDKYKVMDDAYYGYDESKFMNADKLADISEMRAAGFHPGVTSAMRELMAGSGKLSATAREQGLTHQPPVDYRWGVNLGHWWHQVIIIWQLFVYPVDVLWASPTCTPWGANARQWPEEKRTQQRQQESLTLQFLTVLFFIQTLMGKAWMLEQPVGSDLTRASALSVLTGTDSLEKVYPWVFDQCMLGAHSQGEPTKKRTQLQSNKQFHSPPPQCDGSHRHCVLRGSDSLGSRTAQAAVYPQKMCDKILTEITLTSNEIQHGGRAADVHLHRVRDWHSQVHALQKFFQSYAFLRSIVDQNG